MMQTSIKDILNHNTLQTLTSSSDPKMIREESMAKAVKDFVKTIKSLELYPIHKMLIDRFEPIRENYLAIYTHRTFYTWQMSQAGYQILSLNISSSDFLQSNSLKSQAAFLNILFDDICDLSRDKALFEKCVLALNESITPDETGLYRLINDTWSAFYNGIKQAPNYLMLKDTLDEGYQNWIASFEYSLLIQQEAFRFEQKWEKHLEIISHSTFIYLAGLIDLLFVSDLAPYQIPLAENIFLNAQQMGQIANWATTWKRELLQQDFTGGVYSIALQNHWIEWDDFKNLSAEKITAKIEKSPVESYLWDEWERLRVESCQLAEKVHLPSLDGYIESLSVIMYMLVASTGLV